MVAGRVKRGGLVFANWIGIPTVKVHLEDGEQADLEVQSCVCTTMT